MSRALSLAGFEVTLIGRFWVIPEDSFNPRYQLHWRKTLGGREMKLITFRRALEKATLSRSLSNSIARTTPGELEAPNRKEYRMMSRSSP
jgi:hypothetical protein